FPQLQIADSALGNHRQACKVSLGQSGLTSEFPYQLPEAEPGGFLTTLVFAHFTAGLPETTTGHRTFTVLGGKHRPQGVLLGKVCSHSITESKHKYGNHESPSQDSDRPGATPQTRA